jgi:hypothetical protein
MGHNIEQGARGIDVLLKFKGFVASVPRLLKLIQSLSEVVGTHVVLDCKWIITVFYTQYRSPPPPPIPINVAPTKTHQT